MEFLYWPIMDKPGFDDMIMNVWVFALCMPPYTMAA